MSDHCEPPRLGHTPGWDREHASDEQLIKAAHAAVQSLTAWRNRALGPDHLRKAEDAITALGKRLMQRTEEKQAAEDMLAHARELLAPVASGMAELDAFLRHRRA